MLWFTCFPLRCLCTRDMNSLQTPRFSGFRDRISNILFWSALKVNKNSKVSMYSRNWFSQDVNTRWFGKIPRQGATTRAPEGAWRRCAHSTTRMTRRSSNTWKVLGPTMSQGAVAQHTKEGMWNDTGSRSPAAHNRPHRLGELTGPTLCEVSVAVLWQQSQLDHECGLQIRGYIAVVSCRRYDTCGPHGASFNNDGSTEPTKGGFLFAPKKCQICFFS